MKKQIRWWVKKIIDMKLAVPPYMPFYVTPDEYEYAKNKEEK